MQNVSRHLSRRRASRVITVSLFLILNGFIAYLGESPWGLFVTFVTMTILELLLTNAYADTWMPRLGRLPLWMWIYPVVFLLVGWAFSRAPSLFVRSTFGWSIQGSVIIMLIRWFQWHYHVVPIMLRMGARGMNRFSVTAETT